MKKLHCKWILCNEALITSTIKVREVYSVDDVYAIHVQLLLAMLIYRLLHTIYSSTTAHQQQDVILTIVLGTLIATHTYAW